MAVLGTVLKTTTKYAYKLNNLVKREASVAQEKQLRKLLAKAKNTEFGQQYHFAEILKSDDILKAYQEQVPIFDYDYLFKKFWHKTLNGIGNVTWPGHISNFALTSGTTGAASKRIPVSKQMVQTIRKTSIKQLLSLSKIDFDSSFYEKDILFLGGSTQLTKINNQFEGDLSGIITGKVPSWFSPFSKPDKKTRALNNWGEKIEEIVKQAPKWDIGAICGVPAWVEILIQRIVDYYGLDSIFQIWPNLKIYVHGGVSFEPYMIRFNNMLDNQVIYLDTYLTSEGFFAYQPADSDSLHLLMSNDVYFEFIPFNEEHFDSDGNLIDYETSLTINEVVEDVDYALLVSTNSGAWRYLIGDTIKFKCLDTYKIKITGRTKHFLSLCGEHLSVDNMTEALTQIAYELNLDIREFAVRGFTNDLGHGHQWYIASDSKVIAEDVIALIDEKLSQLNDDYRTERSYALTQIKLKCLPTKAFYDFMEIKGMYGSQYKFPRVLKGKMADDWAEYVSILEPKSHPWFLVG